MACRGGCASPSDNHERIRAWYCSRACQRADWKIHRGLCNSDKLLDHVRMRRKLTAAAAILQNIFFASSENTFGFNIHKAERREDKIHLYTSTDCKLKPPFEFPTRFTWTEDEKARLLSFGRCGDAGVVTAGLLHSLLGGWS